MSQFKWVIIILSLFSCESMTNGEPALASAYGNKLYLEDLKEGLSKANSYHDSMTFVSSKVDEWVMDQMQLRVAKDKLGKSENIARMVTEYEKELYLHQLNKVLLKEELDTSITVAEIDTFMARNGQDYLLSEPMVTLLLIKVLANDESDALDDLWKTEDLPGLRVTARQLNGLAMLDPQRWYKVSEIKSLLPQEVNEEVNYSKYSTKVKIVDDDIFFVKILEARKIGDTIPRTVITPKIKKQILKVRSKELLKDWKNTLYQNKIKSKDIIINKLDVNSSLN